MLFQMSRKKPYFVVMFFINISKPYKNNSYYVKQPIKN
ncbi:hypothetical protein RMAECT_1076 [Rickettsia rhipicephali str. Ect]|uniref:Uncharacterized protein n=1 Tax=Rickettsia rhipicephali str. Ect TaxID=1359199 RepID=A0A0F3PGB9_RICRH|nr:hypothetical protein RMAECT_1076 [Rickettsia rhipicephali str. Ect]